MFLWFFSTSGIGEPPVPCKIFQLLLKISWGIFYHYSQIPSAIIIGCHLFSLSLFYLSPTLTCIWGCLMLRDLLSIGHMKVAHGKCLWFPQITCSDGNGPHSLWTLFSLASHFLLLPSSPLVDVTESSKKLKLPLIIYLLLFLPWGYSLLSFHSSSAQVSDPESSLIPHFLIHSTSNP